jgi:AbrB family looped-hinge helix DNA binding protein
MNISNTLTPDTTLTTKGQVTIPSEIRELLGLKPKDKVRFVVASDGSVVIGPAPSRIETLFGAVKPLQPAKNDGTLRREFEEGVAAETMRRA